VSYRFLQIGLLNCSDDACPIDPGNASGLDGATGDSR
jgi:hypothetical protein